MPRAVNSHTFSGHDAKWLNEKEMKQVLGRIPAPLERPSLLNALAYKCGDRGWNGPPCVVKQCTTQLDEINVFVLRQQYAAQCLAMGYSGANKAEPICGVLLDRYDRVQKTFRSFVVKVPGRDGVEQDIPLCGPAWAAVVPNAGYSTFTKLRADVTQGRITRENILPGNMPAKKLLLTMGDGAGQGGEDKGEMEFRLLKSYVRELASTLEHAPVPGGARELEYVVPRETWEQRAIQCEKHFSDNGHEMVVDRRKLKEAWMAMANFVDKAMKSHSKCDDCALYDAQWGSRGRA